MAATVEIKNGEITTGGIKTRGIKARAGSPSWLHRIDPTWRAAVPASAAAFVVHLLVGVPVAGERSLAIGARFAEISGLWVGDLPLGPALLATLLLLLSAMIYQLVRLDNVPDIAELTVWLFTLGPAGAALLQRPALLLATTIAAGSLFVARRGHATWGLALAAILPWIVPAAAMLAIPIGVACLRTRRGPRVAIGALAILASVVASAAVADAPTLVGVSSVLMGGDPAGILRWTSVDTLTASPIVAGLWMLATVSVIANARLMRSSHVLWFAASWVAMLVGGGWTAVALLAPAMFPVAECVASRTTRQSWNERGVLSVSVLLFVAVASRSF